MTKNSRYRRHKIKHRNSLKKDRGHYNIIITCSEYLDNDLNFDNYSNADYIMILNSEAEG